MKVNYSAQHMLQHAVQRLQQHELTQGLETLLSLLIPSWTTQTLALPCKALPRHHTEAPSF